MDLYDEFGNYIGPELEDVDEDDEDDLGYQRNQRKNNFDNDEDDEPEEESYANNKLVVRQDDVMDVAYDENRIVLHEDKKYYPEADEVYPGVKTVTLDEDAQDLKEPIIKPVKQKNFSVLMKDIPKLKYDSDYMTALMHSPNLIRNVALVGNLHHGKTSFVDTLVRATHVEEWDPTKEVRFTDTRIDEQERHLSIKSTPISLVLEDLRDKHYLLNLIDCPGHINFSDESTAAFRAVDGVVLVVDAVEGVMLNTERLIKQAVLAKLPICLVSSIFHLIYLFFSHLLSLRFS